jgi:hypothetical protein
MNPSPHYDPRLLEALEACRPDRGDVADLEMAELAAQLAADPRLRAMRDRLERIDRSIGAAFRDVPVPEGLADRILQQLPLQSPQAEAAPPAAPPGELPSAPRRRSRRWWVAGSVVAALGLSLLVAFGIPFMRLEPLDGAGRRLEQQAMEFFQQDDGGAVLDAAPEDFPFSDRVHWFGELRCRRVEGLAGRAAVAYDFSGPRGERATLYVLRSHAKNLPSEPPRPFSSQDLSVGAWQTDGWVYVLVVQGPRPSYQGLLASPGELT